MAEYRPWGDGQDGFPEADVSTTTTRRAAAPGWKGIAMPCTDDMEEGRVPQALLNHLLKSRTVLINGVVDQDLTERVMSQLLVLDAESHEPIRVFITSQGGHVDSGLAIADVMHFVDSEITTIGAGWVASIAVPILFGAPKKRRMALPNTRFLLHQPSGGAGGRAADIRIEAQQILRIRERLNELIAKETGQSVEKVTHDSDRNFWLTAPEAVEYGLISKVITRASELK